VTTIETLRLTLVSGHIFELPIRCIADDRATYYHQQCPDEFPTLDAAREDSMGLFAGNNSEASEWLLNNMDVDATLRTHAKLVGYALPEREIVEVDYLPHPSKPATPDGDHIMLAPLQLIAEGMADSGGLVSVVQLMDHATGQPAAAVAFMRGGPAVLDVLLQALQNGANAVMQLVQAAQAQAQQEADQTATNGKVH
jgi:hypothetical protein